ncbi:MAG: WD40 repeat domain-containing protein, partial [Nitrospinae bacterium]|nr:WD40 repeat domain-containing protein [Nitrospinota bacterium]
SAIKTLKGHTSNVVTVAFSPDGKTLASGSVDKNVILWDVAAGSAIKTLKGHTSNVVTVTFSPDGKTLASGSVDKNVILWDVAAGRALKTLIGHNDILLSVAFSPDGKFLVSGSGDGTSRCWDINRGREIAQFISFRDAEWIVITPEGYYNSSANGDKLLNVRIGNNVHGMDRFRSVFYKPQIVETALRLGDTQKAISEVIGEQKADSSSHLLSGELPTISTIQNIEPPFITIKSPEDGKKIVSTDAEISIYIEERNKTIKSVKVFINRKLVTSSDEGIGVKIAGVIPEKEKTLNLKIPVHLDIGENLIEVTAFNGFSEGRKSIRIYVE